MPVSTPVTKRMKNAEESANLCPRCEVELAAPDPSFDCAVCAAKYCLRCTRIPLTVYEEIEKHNIQGFAWHCRGCKTSLPTLQNMDKTLKSMDERNDNRLSQIENKLDKLDTTIVEKVKEKVEELKNRGSRRIKNRHRKDDGHKNKGIRRSATQSFKHHSIQLARDK